MQEDGDIKSYLDYLASKNSTLLGDASKRGLAVHGSACCSCSTSSTARMKQVLIFICQECNDQHMWNHSTGTAVNYSHADMLNFAATRQGWRTRAKIAVARAFGRVVPKSPLPLLLLQSPERAIDPLSPETAQQWEAFQLCMSQQPLPMDDLLRTPQQSTGLDLSNLSPL